MGLISDDVDEDGWMIDVADGIKGGLRGAITISRDGLIFLNKKQSNMRTRRQWFESNLNNVKPKRRQKYSPAHKIDPHLSCPQSLDTQNKTHEMSYKKKATPKRQCGNASGDTRGVDMEKI